MSSCSGWTGGGAVCAQESVRWCRRIFWGDEEGDGGEESREGGGLGGEGTLREGEGGSCWIKVLVLYPGVYIFQNYN